MTYVVLSCALQMLIMNSVGVPPFGGEEVEESATCQYVPGARWPGFRDRGSGEQDVLARQLAVLLAWGA